MITATHFPKWFKSKTGSLKTYEAWLEQWKKSNIPQRCFAPPRDSKDPIKDINGNPRQITISEGDGTTRQVNLYKELTQTNFSAYMSQWALVGYSME